VTAAVPEEVSRRVFVGQETACDFDALPGRTFHGRITQVNPAADPQSRQFQIRVRLDNPGYRVKPGMFGRVRLETDRVRNAVTVPREAIKFASGDRAAGVAARHAASVTVIGAEGKAQVREVETGASDDKYIAVTRGLEAGEKVVILSSRPIKAGQQVRVAGADGKGAEGGRPGDRSGNAADGTTASKGGQAR
jgi:membrane fusion protein (multidrug efflux system)